MSKKTKRFDDYDDEDKNYSSRKKLQQEKQRKAQRNLKNQFRSKSFDPSRFTEDE